MDDSRIGTSGRWLALIGLVLVLIAAVRLPFVANVLIDEEGSHGYLVVGAAPVMRGDLGLLVGRMDGVDVLASVQRSPLPYLFIDRVMRPLLGPGDVEGWSIPAITRAARLPFLAVFMIGCLAIAANAARLGRRCEAATRTAIALTFTYAMTVPIVVGGSIQPQLDGAIGVLIVALGGILIAAGRRVGGTTALAAGFSGGFVSGLGKTEWTASLAGAVLVALSTRWLWMRWRGSPAMPATRADTAIAAASLGGVAVALVSVAAFAPAGLVGGVDIATRIAVAGQNPFAILRSQLRLVYPLIVLLVLALAVAAVRIDRLLTQHLAIATMLLWGLAIGIAYFLVGWAGDGFPRHYIPAIALVSIALIGMLSALDPPRWMTRAVAAVAAIGLVVNAVSLTERAVRGRSISSIPGLPVAEVEQRIAGLPRRYAERRQIFFEYSSLGVYFRDIEFAATAVGYPGALEMVRHRRPDFAGELTRP